MTALPIAVLLAGIAATVIQVLLPRIGAARVEARLTESGGEAFVAIDAFPATKLLRHAGDRLLVRGRGLQIGLGSGAPAADPGTGSAATSGLTALDGFREVDVALTEFATGPFAVRRMELARDDYGEPYVMRSEATTTGSALAQFGGDGLGGPAAPLLGAVAGRAPTIIAERSVPVSIEVELRTEDGRLTVAAGGGRIAGYPVGPIASAIAGAVARRLEVGP